MIRPPPGDDDVGPRKPFPGPNAQRDIYRLSPDEIRVLRECNKESFYTRCVPLSVFLGSVTYYGVRTGFLRPNVRFGATPKVMVAATIGYFIGKFSYQSKCAEKLMALPDSRLGEHLRQKKRGVVQEGMEPGYGPTMSLAPFGSFSESDRYSDSKQPSSLDIDTSRPPQDELDDSLRPSVDNPIKLEEEEVPAQQKQITTYDELRKKNREEYSQKKTSSLRETSRFSSQPTTPISSPKGSENTEEDYLSRPLGQKNKYGDTWG